MSARHQVSRTLLELVKAFEGFRPEAARLRDGRWTIGHGHTLTAREGAKVSEPDAESLLIYDLMAICEAVKASVFTPLTQNQFDGLSAFAFNIGMDGFTHSSVLRLVNEGQLLQAAGAMELWRRAEFEGEEIVVDGLVRRRVAEMALFLRPTEGWVPTPSRVLQPSPDRKLTTLAEQPTVLTVAMEGAEAVAQRVVADITLPIILPMDPGSATPGSPPTIPKFVPHGAEDAISAGRSNSEIGRDTFAMRAGSLPAPLWPVRLTDGDSAFVLTSPPEVSAEPTLDAITWPETSPGLVDDEPMLFDYSAVPPALPEIAAPQATGAAPKTVEADLSEASLEAPPAGLAPVLGLGLLGIAFFGGGLYWSANGGSTQSPINPWIVGWIACLVGVVFAAIAANLFLTKLGHLEPEDDEFAPG